MQLRSSCRRSLTGPIAGADGGWNRNRNLRFGGTGHAGTGRHRGSHRPLSRRVLAALRDNIVGICDPGTWSLLGGNRDSADEAPEAAIARELKEEEAGLVLPELKKYIMVDAHGPFGGQITVFLGHWDGDAQALPSCVERRTAQMRHTGSRASTRARMVDQEDGSRCLRLLVCHAIGALPPVDQAKEAPV
ncbi:NUDIX domain-containing protein [Streptomyces sp. NPDC020799]|uniref:NUDIX domain-containing protein n=1 Tax=Streptomyces sp. NPDC020799 TaxID=3365091 RepID=UPI0037A8FA1F